MKATALVTYVLATWRLTSLLVNEAGPGDILAKLRHTIGVRYDRNSQPTGNNIAAEALTCVWCASIWIAFLFAALSVVVEGNGRWPVRLYRLLSRTLALSAGAIAIDTLIVAHEK